MTDQPYAVRAWVRGRVQGVGFRWWTRARALERGLVGHARNCADGRVEVWAQGERSEVEALVDLLQGADGVLGRPGAVTGVVAQPQTPRDGLSGFQER